MRVWVEKTGESGGFVNVPTGSNVQDCLSAAQIKYVSGEKIFLNGLDIINGRKVDLSTVVKENDSVQVVPNYSGGIIERAGESYSSFFRGYTRKLPSESLIPSLR